jgi:G3E family GTPase
VDRIKRIKRAQHPDWLVIEPSGMVVTKELRDVAAMGLRDVQYDVGPLVALVDGPNFDFIWNERQHLVKGQMDGADVVAVSRTDRLDEARHHAIQKVLAPHAEHLYLFSSQNDAGVEKVWQCIEMFTRNDSK